MGRRELPVDPEAGVVEAFAHALRELRVSAGTPPYRAMARRAGYSASALSAAASGAALPSLEVALAYAGACGGDREEWMARWRKAAEPVPTAVPQPPLPIPPSSPLPSPSLSPSPPPSPPPPTCDPLSSWDPREAGGYRLRGRIGAGSMGQVYLAYTEGGRALAVKVVRPELAEDEEFRRRFRHEVAAARRVHGLFTAQVLDAGTEAPRPWLATTYVPGPSLQDAVANAGPLPTDSVWLLTAGVAEALRTVRSAGLIHRDLKPSNVLLAADGPRVIDFGIARASDATTLTRTGIRLGAPQFMAPEHVLGRDLTFAADVFALGALVVFAATGRSPFGDGVDAAVLYRVVHEEPDLDGLPDALRELVAACLVKEPDRRPGLSEVIRRCAEGSGRTSLRIAPDWLPAAYLSR
jgi:hypothetical protein